jgi:hypothetical protein
MSGHGNIYDVVLTVMVFVMMLVDDKVLALLTLRS